MTGARITATLDAGAWTDAIAQLAALTKNFEPLLKRAGVALVETTLHRFETATDPQGTAWKPLDPVYEEMKRGPGILREKAMRGGLMGSMTFQVASAREVMVGSGKVYAAIHQFGGVIRPVNAKALIFHLGKRVVHAGSVTMPARPYLGFGEADRVAVLEQVRITLDELLQGG